MNDEARREPVLRVADLRLAYRVDGELRETIRGLSFQVERGEAYALVGESGCGKSTVAFAAVHYLPDNTVHLGGQILLAGQDIRALSWKQRRLLRKSVVSMVYQNAATALNPTIRIGDQVARRGLARRRRCVAQGPDFRRREGPSKLSATAVGRHAAACRHCDGNLGIA
jgi:peptide/nickel transport system ATP-binding protein